MEWQIGLGISKWRTLDQKQHRMVRLRYPLTIGLLSQVSDDDDVVHDDVDVMPMPFVRVDRYES